MTPLMNASRKSGVGRSWPAALSRSARVTAIASAALVSSVAENDFTSGLAAISRTWCCRSVIRVCVASHPSGPMARVGHSTCRTDRRYSSSSRRVPGASQPGDSLAQIRRTHASASSPTVFSTSRRWFHSIVITNAVRNANSAPKAVISGVAMVARPSWC